jgi:hypothetical protein
MQHDFLSDLLGNPSRARLLRLFTYNQSDSFFLADVMKRTGISSENANRELRALENLQIIKNRKVFLPKSVPQKQNGKNGKAKRPAKPKRESAWSFNPDFKYRDMLSSFVQDVSPARYDLIMKMLRRSGKISVVILSGVFMGDGARPADLLVAGEGLNDARLEYAVKTLEPIFGREIRYAAFSTAELRYRLTVQDRLMRDTLDFPHLVLFDRVGLLTQ